MISAVSNAINFKAAYVPNKKFLTKKNVAQNDLKNSEPNNKNSENRNVQLKLFAMLGVVAAIVAMPIISHVRKSINPGYLNSNYYKADSIMHSADTLANDTIKFMSNLK